MNGFYKRTVARALVAACALASATVVRADDSAYAFGGWSGERARLADSGVLLGSSYVSEVAHNLSGGNKQLTRHAGQLAFDATFDLDKLWGFSGALFRVTITERDGNSLNRDAGIDALMQPQEVYGRNQTWRLTQFWYGQDLAGGAVQLKVGRLAVGEDFSVFECSFMNLAFCGDQSGNLVGYYWFNYPVSQWGGVAKIDFSTQHYLKFGAYQVNPSYLRTNESLALNPAGTTGALFPVEFGWTPRFSGDLAGSYVVGGWYTTANQTDLYTDVDGHAAGKSGLPFKERAGSYGGYLTFSQQLSHGDGVDALSGARVFFNATQADRSTSRVDREIAVGVIQHGLVGRHPDEIGVALSMTHSNSRLANYVREVRKLDDAALPVVGKEITAEVFYGWQAARWLVVRPNLQWIHQPGGNGQRNDVCVAGLKSIITF